MPGHVVSADSSAPPEVVWPLLARPDRWSTWSPHVRGAWGLGSPEVEEGRRGAVRLLGAVPVPARIVRVAPPGPHGGRGSGAAGAGAWSWRVGPVTMDHRVRALPDGGTRIAMALDAPLPFRPAVAAYAPVCELLLQRLARVAAGG